MYIESAKYPTSESKQLPTRWNAVCACYVILDTIDASPFGVLRSECVTRMCSGEGVSIHGTAAYGVTVTRHRGTQTNIRRACMHPVL